MSKSEIHEIECMQNHINELYALYERAETKFDKAQLKQNITVNKILLKQYTCELKKQSKSE